MQQRLVHLCLESTGNIGNPDFYSAMHLTATYQLSSDLPTLYAPGNLRLFAAPQDNWQGGGVRGGRDRLAMFVISHCGLPRDLYLRQVVTHVCHNCMFSLK